MGRGRHIQPGGLAQRFYEALHIPHAEPTVEPILEQRLARRRGEPTLSIEPEQHPHAFLRRFVEGDQPGTATLAKLCRHVECLPDLVAHRDVENLKTRQFTDTQAGVQSKDHQRPVPLSKGMARRNSGQQLTGFGT